MTDIRIVREAGSHRLVERQGQFAVVECRNGQVFALQHSDAVGAPDTPDGIAAVIGPDGWTDHDTAESRMRDVTERGEDLARTIW